MARGNGRKHWEEVDRYYSYSSYSEDDSPIITYRYDKLGRASPERRWVTSLVARASLICGAVLSFCLLMYIPVYNRAAYQLPRGIVEGWSSDKSRDTKIYVQPNNITTKYEPLRICHRTKEKEKLFLLVVVCSSTDHFEIRSAIRETWANYDNFKKTSKIFNLVKSRYKNYNYTYDLYPNFSDLLNNASAMNVSNISGNDLVKDNIVNSEKKIRHNRDISSINQLLPELAKALQSNLRTVKTDTVPDKESGKDVSKDTFEEEKRFDDEEILVPEFDMNKELGAAAEEKEYEDYNEVSNVMKIPPRGYEDEPNLTQILTKLKQSKIFPESKEKPIIASNTGEDFKVVFLLGMPPHENDTETQAKIDEEVLKYGDVIQEGFVDSYNNLTLKSIMMLKWVVKNCNDSVRYILKSDDDIYINLPNLLSSLRHEARKFDTNPKHNSTKEYLLIGDLINGAKPVLDIRNKWYSPRYMFDGRVYPSYLSGASYLLSEPTAHTLYRAALNTPLFHLEDIYITGICSKRGSPAARPRDSALFSYSAPRGPCAPHALGPTHRVPAPDMRRTNADMQTEQFVDRCERICLTKVRWDRLKAKMKRKKPKLTKMPWKH